MTKALYHALVASHDPIVRNLAVRALAHEGFACWSAADGREARMLLSSNPCDVLVTGLRMPHQNGHSLVVDLLRSANRPAIVVLTGVLEPRLAKDLIRRGVDFVEFRPVHYGLLAAKISALVERRAVHPEKPSHPVWRHLHKRRLSLN